MPTAMVISARCLELELRTMRGFKQGKVEVKDAFTFKDGAWVPWYTQHKVLAGLRDAWTLGESAASEEVTLKLANWVDDITAGLTPEQQQDDATGRARRHAWCCSISMG